jgi:DNA-binding NtrC family response regulator
MRMSEIYWQPGVTLDAIEKQVILKAFQFFGHNKTHTAHALGIAIRTLDNKLAKYEKEQDGQADRIKADQAGN